ncbi:MAG: disulfide bond formation protein B [Rhodospirillales bacterium]|nr:disulfide bond formation protein B [Rhodospirillales bacterium]
MNALFLSPKTVMAVLLIAAAGPLAIALGAQYIGGLEPCVLCKYQRIPYWTVAAMAITGYLIDATDRRGILYLAALIFLAGTALAFYHVGVEQHWWISAARCGATETLPANFEAFRASPLKPLAKSCDDIDWTLFGLSFTVYNTAVSLFLTVACVFAAGRVAEKKAG